MKGRISVRGINDNARKINKKLTFKNSTLFRLCISKINNTSQDNAKSLHILIPMYNLFEYSDNYSMTSGNLWSHYKDEVNDAENENNNVNNRINSIKTITSKLFEYKTKIIQSTPNINNILDAEVVVPLKYLRNFWRSLDLSLINFEMELDLRCRKSWVMSEISQTFRVVVDSPEQKLETKKTGATFQINNAKLYFQLLLCLSMIISKFYEK